MLNLIDEHSRECLMIRPERRWSSAKVIEALADVMVMKGVPEHLRSDNGPEFVARDLRKWLAGTGARTAYIEPGSPWENGYRESSNSKLRDEFLNGEIFYAIKELRVLAERWRIHYNTVRPHSSLAIVHHPQKPGRQKLTRGMEKGNRSALPTSPHPRLRLSSNSGNHATLTIHWYKSSGRSQRARQTRDSAAVFRRREYRRLAKICPNRKCR